MQTHQATSVDRQLRVADSKPVLFPPVQCFLIGLAVLLPIVPEARLTLFDAIAALVVFSHWRDAAPLFKRTAILLGISITAMIFSASMNGSAMPSLVGRGYVIAVLLVEALSYFIIINRTTDRGRTLLVLGVMIGICCHYFYPTDERIQANAIKFLIGIPLGTGVLAFYALVVPRASASVSVVLIEGFMLAYALFCFFVGSRSIGGVFFASTFVVAAAALVRIPLNYGKIAPLIILGILAATYIFSEIYAALAIGGFFGDSAAAIAAHQRLFGSILLGGRPEIYVNIAGVKDNPLLGAGILNYPSIYTYEIINLNIYSTEDVISSDNILYHSALFGTAFESGIIAAVFWLYSAYLTLACLPLTQLLKPVMRAFAAPLLVMTVWHIVYSPPIPYNRYVMAIGLGLAFYIYNCWRQGFMLNTDADPKKTVR